MPDDRLPGEDAQRLDELTRDEFRVVAKRLRPDVDDAEYDRMWERFEYAKRLRSAQ